VRRVEERRRDLAREHKAPLIRSAVVALARTYEATDTLEARATALASAVPRAQDALESFLRVGQATVVQWAAIQASFRALPAVSEILEIPMLMDACIRSGAHEEALQVDQFARRLLLVLGGGRSNAAAATAALSTVVAEVDRLRGVLQRTLEE
jgi:hypothetical protein